MDGLWYEVKILELEAQRAKVHYVGFGNDEDEWLPFTHFRLQESRSELSSEVTVLRKQVESMSERFQLSAEQAQMKQAVADLQKQVESLQHQVDSITQKLTLNPEEPAKATVASAKATATPDPSDPGGPKTAVLEAPDAAAALQQQMLSLTEQVDLSKTQTEQVASMVERLAETMQKQALDASNMEQAFVRSESKIIGLQASSVSVLEGRLRVFVKTELDHTVLAAMEDCNVMQRLDVVENLQQQRVAAVEEETQWLREVVEVLSESVGFDLVPRDGTRRSSAARAKSRDLASPEGRNAALFDQLDTNGDDEVNLQEFQAAQVATGQRKVDLFDELDSNLDGRVTREEFAAVTVDARPRFGHGPRKPSSRPHEELEMSMDNQWMGEDALIGAVLAEDSERALTLLRTADVTVRDKEGCTALHRASALPGLARVRRALLEKGGARLASMRDLHMRTPLHHAALAGCLEACQQLLDAASFHDADRRALHGRTALHLAAEYGRAEVCRCLLDHPKFTVVDAADDYGHTGLHHAAMQGHAAVCQALLEHPRFIGEGAKDKEGWTAFHWAASGGFATVCRILLASPSFAEVATRTARGWTALHLAAAHGLEEVVHVLLKHPRFKVVTAQDCVGRNALHAAAEAGHRNVCKLLMAHENFRVLATTKDYGGNRASDLATGAALEVPLH